MGSFCRRAPLQNVRRGGSDRARRDIANKNWRSALRIGSESRSQRRVFFQDTEAQRPQPGRHETRRIGVLANIGVESAVSHSRDSTGRLLQSCGHSDHTPWPTSLRGPNGSTANLLRQRCANPLRRCALPASDPSRLDMTSAPVVRRTRRRRDMPRGPNGKHTASSSVSLDKKSPRWTRLSGMALRTQIV